MLSAYYHAPFDVSTLALGTITVATAGKPDVVVNLVTLVGPNDDASANVSIFWHYQGSGSGNSGWCTSDDGTDQPRLTHHCRAPFHLLLEQALQAEATVQGWTSPSGLTVAFRRQDDPITYRIAYATAAITVTWSTAAGRSLMGFTANTGSATSHDGTAVPTYVVTPTLEFTSNDTPNTEEQEISTHVTPDDNSAGYGVSRYVARVRRDWVQQFETKQLSIRRYATTNAPWTFQHLFEYCRGELPFAVATVIRGTTTDDVEFFILERSNWRPERATPGNDAQFHIHFDCLVVGAGP